jgi:hypothetical protein
VLTSAYSLLNYKCIHVRVRELVHTLKKEDTAVYGKLKEAVGDKQLVGKDTQLSAAAMG